MKKWLLSLLAFLTAFTIINFSAPKEAHAQLSLELIGKLGGKSTYIEKESFGDSIFDVGGGLQFTTLFRFEQGTAVGLNFNWTMIEQRLKRSELSEELGVTERWMTVQHPSFGFALRHAFVDFAEFGLWLNYGFGTVNIDWKGMNIDSARRYGLDNANLKWKLQSFELGLLLQFRWNIPSTHLHAIFGLQGFMDISRMYPSDNSLAKAKDRNDRNLDENSINTFGFMFVFGLSYDFYFESFGKRAPN
ncbi:MAG: hypothetical protein FWC40_02395 [Proteobacteria bacterium]|nr:hypothetical protein [Pseudomonadota bacterium]